LSINDRSAVSAPEPAQPNTDRNTNATAPPTTAEAIDTITSRVLSGKRSQALLNDFERAALRLGGQVRESVGRKPATVSWAAALNGLVPSDCWLGLSL
jgi:hypothetical protein